MSRSGAARSALGSPVLVGAITVLVTVVAVFLAYNANAGLPFIPTTQLRVAVPNATKLVVGNEVREGGFRVGVISEINPTQLPSGEAAAELVLKIDQKSAPLPSDTTVAVRPRSALGLRYVQIIRGTSAKTLADGATVRISRRAIAPELEDFFATFRPKTRTDIQRNLTEFGAAFAGRGEALNRTIASLPKLLGTLQPVAKTLADPDTGLGRFFRELDDSARVTAPVADRFAEGFASAADTFEAISRDPQALRETISKSPETLRVGTDSLRAQRPFLMNLADISPAIRGTASELRRSLPVANTALAAGTSVLPRTVELNEQLGRSFTALRELTSNPTTASALRGLTATVTTLNPTIRFAGPHITVCNYWNYFWNGLQDHIGQENNTGTVQRIEAKQAPMQTNTPTTYGATQPANGEPINPLTSGNGDSVNLHAQAYGRAIDEKGNADCETGQRGYPRRLAKNAPPNFNIAIDPRTPGSQGPTYTGLPSVPKGETFTAEPETGFKVTP